MTIDKEIEILDQLDALNEKITQTEEYKQYCHYRLLLDSDTEVKNLIDKFSKLKIDFEEVQRFGKYHPDFSTKRREINQFKKEMDMNPVIMEFRRAEYKLQEMLDEVLYHISQVVSEHVNVVSNNPFFASGDSLGCSTGGSCGCKVG
ncbi:YlbF family regulator [Corticicoccus populi]|uniref:YlbF family regulator n=1 Tax=Corticicoccus populi TaxID=1812821 RepID=A0ABW5WVD3_9STAP